MAYFKVIFRRWEAWLHVLSTVPCNSKGKKLHLLPSPQIRGAHLGNLSHFTFFLSRDNDNLFFPRFPSAGVLAKDRERMEKYLDAGTWAASLRWEACVCACSWCHSFIRCGLGLGRVTRKAEEGGGQPMVEASHTYLNPTVPPSSARGVNIWVSLNFFWTSLPSHYRYSARYHAVCTGGPVMVEMQRGTKAEVGEAKDKKSKLGRKFSKCTWTPGEKNSGLKWSTSYPKEIGLSPQRPGFLGVFLDLQSVCSPPSPTGTRQSLNFNS